MKSWLRILRVCAFKLTVNKGFLKQYLLAILLFGFQIGCTKPDASSNNIDQSVTDANLPVITEKPASSLPKDCFTKNGVADQAQLVIASMKPILDELPRTIQYNFKDYAALPSK